MNNSIYLLMAFLILWTHTATSFATLLREPMSKDESNHWSETINGLSGRIRVELDEIKPGLRYAVYLDVRNHSLNPVAVTNQPQIHAELFDSVGKRVTTSAFPISGPILAPQWAVIPRDAYLGFRIDMQTVGVPAREQEIALMAVGGKNWGLKSGSYLLVIALTFQYEESGPKNQWVGEIKLPPVGFVITPEMLAIQ